ncbi:MAG: UDP-3-O-(3-hydroxymyristoyl)glucosamine N-acyltransferase [Planctomycetota bacterium]|nr:MAG: UDP-3-O-(3-hydroxymyristoyl)glucosamine N-acyltransferase [Planctomycetota bacterium]
MSDPPSITVEQLARELNAPFAGDGARILRRVDPLSDAGDDSLSWLGDARYARQLADTRAAAVLVAEAVEAPPHVAVIRVPDPDHALITALQMLAPPPETVADGVHPTAVVDPTAAVEGVAIGPHCAIAAGAVIGAGTQLHAGVVVGRDARIGRDCELHAHVVVHARCVIGDRVVIHANSTIGADGFGYLTRNGVHVKIPQIGIVRIEDDVEIGANSCVDRARSGETRIARGVKIDNQVQIGHNCEIGEHSILVAQSGVSGSCRLGRYVVLAGGVGVADHVELGDGVQVAAMSGVPKSFPPGMTIRGIPAMEVGQYSRIAVEQRRLPKLAATVRDLKKRIERLESAAHDTK